MFCLFLPVAALCLISQALPVDKPFLMLFGHQNNNLGDMTIEFSGSTGGSSSSGNTGNSPSGVSSGTFGSHNGNGVPGYATYYLDNIYKYYQAISGGNAGYVQHAGNCGPDFASQSASTGYGTDHIPGKCPWVGCSTACQDTDSVTGCIVCITGCGATTNGGSGTSLNTGSSTNPGSGQTTGGSTTHMGTGQLAGAATGGNSPNTGTAAQNGGTGANTSTDFS